MSKQTVLDQLATFGNGKPSKQWAYDLLERAQQVRLRRLDDRNVTPAAIKIAEEAVRLDQFGRVQEIANGEI